MYQELLRENARLREEVMWLRRERERLQDKLSGRKRGVEVRYVRSLKKGQGAHYGSRIRGLNRHHRRLLFYLIAEGATDGSKAVPMIHLKRKYRLPTGPTAGRCSELIGKGFVGCHRVPITMQYDAEGVLGYRPATELDPNLGVVKRRKFTYWATRAGIEALLREAKPSDDDFLRAMPNLEVLQELKKAIAAKRPQGEKVYEDKKPTA